MTQPDPQTQPDNTLPKRFTTYRHTNGNLYVVTGFPELKNDETGEWEVVVAYVPRDARTPKEYIRRVESFNRAMEEVTE